MLKTIRKALELEAIRNIDMNSQERISIHREIITSKPMMRNVFFSFFEKIDFLDKKHFESTGPRIEIGAGAFPINECIDGVIASDYVDGSHLGMKLDALDMDLPDRSVGAFYGQNVFHHFDDPEKFFAEADRCLQPGGGIILIEPYFGPFAQAVYKNLSDGESFDKNQKNWNSGTGGPMVGANQALSYIVFIRDRADFEKKFPHLQITEQYVFTNFMRYLLSGGLNFRQLVPSGAGNFIKAIEFLLSPLSKILSLHHAIVIKKCNLSNT